MDGSAHVDERILAYYERGEERDRLGVRAGPLEYARAKEILLRFLPDPPSSILDVGGGPGPYASWLSQLGYEVRLIDPVPLHVEQALEATASSPISAAVGDAGALDEDDCSYDAVLLMGPLYHLLERDERLQAIREARRVLRPGGILAASSISRWAAVLDGLIYGWMNDDEITSMVEGELADGRHDVPAGSTTHGWNLAYLHRPEELAAEVAASFELLGVFGIQGPGWLLQDFRERWSDPAKREIILRAARMVETEPLMIGLSAHLLAVGRRPQ